MSYDSYDFSSGIDSFDDTDIDVGSIPEIIKGVLILHPAIRSVSLKLPQITPHSSLGGEKQGVSGGDQENVWKLSLRLNQAFCSCF